MNKYSFKILSSILAFVSTVSFAHVSSADASGFQDVDQSNPYAAYILDLQAKGIVDGIEDGKYVPTALMTRAEFVKILVKAANLPLDKNHFHFSDLNGNWAATYIQTAWVDGLISGITDNTFAPDAPIKREEAATVVWRYLKVKGVSPSVQNFMLPSTVDDWAREGVAQSIAKKLFGVPFKSGTYRDAINREEAAALVDLAMNQQPSNPQAK